MVHLELACLVVAAAAVDSHRTSFAAAAGSERLPASPHTGDDDRASFVADDDGATMRLGAGPFDPCGWDASGAAAANCRDTMHAGDAAAAAAVGTAFGDGVDARGLDVVVAAGAHVEANTCSARGTVGQNRTPGRGK